MKSSFTLSMCSFVTFFDFSAAATLEAGAKSWTAYLSETWLPMSAK
jgi:hypothetical protein